MDTFGVVIAATLTIWGLAIIQAPVAIWLFTFFIAILSLFLVQIISSFAFFIFTVTTVLLCLLLAYKPTRRKFITKFLYSFGKKALPTMSETEKEAIAAGETWWEADLFQGKPDWNKMLAMPKARLNKDELHFLDNQVDTLCKMLNDWQINTYDKDLPQQVWDYLKQEKFFALQISKKYGGLEFCATANSQIIQKIASRSVSAAVTVMVPNSLGPAELLIKYGTDAQKEEYLPKLATGEHIPCFGLTSLEAGSDATNMTDSGIICHAEFAGKKILGIKLNWEKRYITLAPVATILGIAFKLYDPDKLLGNKQELGITVCLVPANLPGVEVGRRHLPLNLAFMNGPMSGKDVFVPLDYVIGGKAQLGKGWRMLVESLAVGRGISLPALATSAAKHSFRTTGAYAAIREQFKVAIGRFEGVQEAMAKIGAYSYICEATSLFTTVALDRKIKPAVVTAIVKYHLTELGRKAMSHAMDIHGGKGILTGPKNYLAKLFESMPIGITVEGANILTRNLIIFGQGAIRCHPYLKAEIHALQNPDNEAGIKEFDKAVFSHVSYLIANFAKLKAHLITGGLFFKKGKDCSELSKYFKILGKYSLSLACVSDISLLVLGKDLKRKESLSARLGDALSYLYLASAVIKYYSDNGRSAEDLVFVRWILDFLLSEITTTFSNFFDNFPNRYFAFNLKLLILPFSSRRKRPSDEQNRAIANVMLDLSKLRSRLIKNLYHSQEKNDIMFVLEQAFVKLRSVQPILDKLKEKRRKNLIPNLSNLCDLANLAKAKKILTDKELTRLIEFDDLRKHLISVDDFTEQEISGK